MANGQSNSLPPIRTPLSQWVHDFKRGPMIAIVWIVAAGLATLMLSRRAGEMEYVGIAMAHRHEVSGPLEGRIDEIAIAQFDHLEAGDLIALLDATGLEARIATAQARIDMQVAELDAARVRLQSGASGDEADLVDDLRRFQINETELRLEALELETDLATDRIERDRLGLQLERTAALVSESVATEAELDDIRLEHEEVVRRIEMNEHRLEQTRSEWEAAQARREDFESQITLSPGDEELLLRSLTEAVRVESMQLQELMLERRNLALRAPVAGTVEQIWARPGQTVRAGDPVATITAEEPAGIVYYIPDTRLSPPLIDSEVLIARMGDPTSVGKSVILEVGSSVEQMPERLWRDPNIPEYGLPVLVATVPEMGLLPGEPVRVRLLN